LRHVVGDVAAASIWPPEAAIRPGRSAAAGPGGEVLLWAAMRLDADLVATGLDLSSEGPLWSRDDWSAIEVWTEAELCGLHALWRLARTRSSLRVAARRRLASAIAWHLEHTQPDNATNRPWALHAFLLAGPPEARLYAETLLHNAQAHGSNDPTTRWILADAARELELVLNAVE
jgi:hypothetical protein